MFENLRPNITSYHAEAITTDYFIRGLFQSLGSTPAFLNDHSHRFAHFNDVEMAPLMTDRQMGMIRREWVTVNKNLIVLLSFLDKEEAAGVQIIPARRPVIFYLSQLAVQGQIHVNPDAHDKDLLDETRAYVALSDASIFPVHSVGLSPTRQVPLCFININLIHAYHTHSGQAKNKT